MLAMRKASEDEDEAEQRFAVAKARWDRRADAVAKIHLELSRLQYLRPALGPTTADTVHAKIAAAVAGCQESIAAHSPHVDQALLQLLEQKLADMFTSLQVHAAASLPPPSAPVQSLAASSYADAAKRAEQGGAAQHSPSGLIDHSSLGGLAALEAAENNARLRAR